MLKSERLQLISKMVNEKGVVNVNDIISALKVSDMTVRRDLDELERSGKLIRIHGGAQSLNYNVDFELTHEEKAVVKIEEKSEIASLAASMIHKGDTVYLGPGTTIELLAECITEKDIRVVTNSLPAFEKLKNKGLNQVLLAGGEYRDKTGAFIGPMTQRFIKDFKFSSSFISCNGILEEDVTASSLEEGEIQRTALNHSKNRYLLADDHKFNREDFYVYYKLYNLDGIITDSSLDPDLKEHYSQYTRIIEPQQPASEEVQEPISIRTNE